MTKMYGNYDPKSRDSLIPDREATTFDWEWNDGPPIAFPLFGVVLKSHGSDEFLFLTYAKPRDQSFDCHACAPMIGMAEFTRSGQSWIITASSHAVVTSGEFGKPPSDIRAVKVGPGHVGVQIKDVGSGGGETTVVLILLIPYLRTVNLAFERIIADDDAGTCGDEGGSLPCYANRRYIAFLQGPDPEYYDLELSLAGTDLSQGPPYKSVHVRGLERHRMRDGKYVPLFRRGDTTSLDRYIASLKNSRKIPTH